MKNCQEMILNNISILFLNIFWNFIHKLFSCWIWPYRTFKLGPSKFYISRPYNLLLVIVATKYKTSILMVRNIDLEGLWHNFLKYMNRFCHTNMFHTNGLTMNYLSVFWIAHCDDLRLLRSEAATVGCGRSPQHSSSHREPIRGRRPPYWPFTFAARGCHSWLWAKPTTLL